MKRFLLPLIGMFTLSFYQCSDSPEDIQIDPAFAAYISAFTSGIISNNDVITVKLNEPVSGITINAEVEDELFDFSPGVDGHAYWVDDRTIEFRPSERMPSGKRYEVEFELGDVIDVPDELETFVFSFQIIEQAVFVEMTSMQPYRDEDLKLQIVKGKVVTADLAEAEVLEEIFSASQEGNKRFLHWTHTHDGRNHSFVIDSVDRKEERSSVEISWNGNDLEVDDGKQNFDIPSLSEFLVMAVNVVQEPEQRVEIYFSDPLKTTQNLEGLIYFSSQKEIRLNIESNTVQVYPQKKLSGDHELVIEEFIVNSLGYKLMATKRQTLAFTSHKPAVEILGKGVIVPNVNGVVLPFKAVNLTAVDFRIVKVFETNIAQFLQENTLSGNDQMRRVGRLVKKGSINLKSNKTVNYSSWNNFFLDLSEYVETEPGAIYRVSLSFRPSQSLYHCDSELEDSDSDMSLLNDPEYAEYDVPIERYDYYEDYYWDYNDNYRWSDREDPCRISYYLRGNNVVSRNVLASDLGIIAKGGDDDKMHVFITDLKSSDPLSGVKVELYNYQQQLIKSSETNGDGMVVIEMDKQVPFLLIAKMNEQRGYLRLDNGTSRSVSMFNVGGKSVQNGLKGFIYGERGVWRPGDSLFLSVILEDELGKLPKAHPVVMELYTPENKLYLKKVQSRSLNGFYDFRTKTDDKAPTGNWTAKVRVGGLVFNKRIKIESIKPNRLKINIDFGSKILTRGGSNQGTLSSLWLHGAKASNLKADIEMSLTNQSTEFKNYPGYHFDDPTKEFSAEKRKVFEGMIDGSGEALFTPRIELTNAAPGMLNARFVTRVFERGGDFSIDRYDISYSPYSSYVGVNVPKGKGWNEALYSDETTLVPVATVNQEGEPVGRNRLLVEIYKIDWRWWWEHDDVWSLANYVSNKNNNLIKSDRISTVNGKATYQMKFEKPFYGRCLMIVTDEESGHSAGQLFYMSYSSWWNDPKSVNPGGAEMLSFSTDKEEYKVDEEVSVKVPAFTEGRLLVTLENGSRILREFWVKPSEAQGGIKFKATAKMAPNTFVSISLVQPHSKSTNNLPIRLYGIEKIKVYDPKTVLNPVIEMPAELEPEKKVKIKVSEKEGKAMTYTLAVVDDGLLDLTRFKTPDPWSDFYSLQALGVKTWDIYPYVLGDFGVNPDGLLAIGGDEGLKNGNNKKANRFVPVVKFLGPFELDAGDENDHEFVMPNYIGSVRTMVVAGQGGAYGNAEFTSKVKKPVMILPTVPRVIGPGETVTIPVSVFAMDEAVEEVQVSIASNSQFTIVGKKSKTVSFSDVGEKMVYFEVKAKQAIGLGKFQFNATGGSYKASYKVEIEVRPANPVIVKMIDGDIAAGSSLSQEYSSFGISGTERASLELTTLPPLGLNRHLKYLVRYPYGCIEQTTSSVFAQLILGDLMELDAEKMAEIQRNISAGISRIATFQSANGGLTYWPGEDYISEWGTNYAGHFMIEAQERGYSLPSGFLNAWINCQKQLANSWKRKITTWENKHSDLTQSYRLYTLAKAGRPALGAMNRMMQMKGLNKAAVWNLAGAYSLVGKKEVARSLLQGLDHEIEAYRELSYTYGSRNRDLAMILEVMVVLEDPAARDLMVDLASIMSTSEWLSTHETAYMLMAISKAAGATSGGNKNVKAEMVINGEKSVVDAGKSFAQINIPLKGHAKGKVVISNKGGKVLFSRIVLEGVPPAGEEPVESKNLSMTTRFVDLSGSEINPERLEQGRDFMVEIRVSNPGTRADYKEMVLDQIFPSGWEIRNTRMDAVDGQPINKNVRYQDIRDDRVYTFYDLDRNESKTFKILLNATYTGRFYLPSFKSGAMYDQSINANSQGRWVEVVNSSIQ